MNNTDILQLKKIIREELEPVNKKLDAHTVILDSHTESLVNIEQTLGGYADMYKVNSGDINKLKQRITAVEHQTGITPQD